MMTISSEQIRAGRALLDWSQKELAKHAGLSLNALNNIERGVANPKLDTMLSIQKALEDAGVEFLDAKGVRLQGERLEIDRFEGAKCLEAYYNEFLTAFPEGDGEVVFNGISNNRVGDMMGKRLEIYRRFEKEAMRRNICERCLIKDQETTFMAQRNIFRWSSDEFFSEMPFAVYGDNVAMLLWGPPMRLIVIRNHDIAKTFRKQFEFMWQSATPVPDDIWDFHRSRDGIEE